MNAIINTIICFFTLIFNKISVIISIFAFLYIFKSKKSKAKLKAFQAIFLRTQLYTFEPVFSIFVICFIK